MLEFPTNEPFSAPARSSDPTIAAILKKDYTYFDISPRTGFLDIEHTAICIPSTLREHEWEVVLATAQRSRPPLHGALTDMDKANPWRNCVHLMVVVESLSTSLTESTALLRRAYVVLCMLGHLYLHGASGSENGDGGSCASGSTHRKAVVPGTIAIPWLLVSDALGLKPVLSYASQVLWNCAYTNKSPKDDLPLSDQIRVLETFTGHSSEIAFDIAPARVELEGAVILRAIFDVLATHFQGSDLFESQRAVTNELCKIETALKRMKNNLLVLKKECDPVHFYSELRPWIAGSGPDGWTYELGRGSEIHLQVAGSTAGSSSLLQALDSFLGVHLSESQLSFRHTMQEYMPRGHRRFVQKLEELKVNHAISPASMHMACENPVSPLRAFIQHACQVDEEHSEQDLLRECSARLASAYNSVLQALKKFRDEHFRIVSLFVIIQARKSHRNIEEGKVAGENEPEKSLKGTGGSDLAILLKGFRDSSKNTLLDM